MEFRQRLLNCFDNIFGKLNPVENYTKPVERLDEETHTIALVCFSLASLSILPHLLLVLCLHSVRQIYGPLITLALFWYLVSQSATLLSCSLEFSSPEHWLVGNIADFGVLATLSTTLMSTIGVCRQLWLGVMLTPSGSVQPVPDVLRFQVHYVTIHWRGNFVYTLVSVCFILIYPMALLVGSAYYPENVLWNMTRLPSGADSSNFSCNIVPNRARFHLIFPGIFAVIAAQLVCAVVCAWLRYQGLADCSMLEQVVYLKSRFWINTKFSVTHGLIWPTAFVAVYWPSLTVWHVFTLLCSLQAIYMTVNCIFSRPILDCLHQWQEGRLDLEAKHVSRTVRHTKSALVMPSREAKRTKRDLGESCEGRRVVLNLPTTES